MLLYTILTNTYCRLSHFVLGLRLYISFALCRTVQNPHGRNRRYINFDSRENIPLLEDIRYKSNYLDAGKKEPLFHNCLQKILYIRFCSTARTCGGLGHCSTAVDRSSRLRTSQNERLKKPGQNHNMGSPGKNSNSSRRNRI